MRKLCFSFLLVGLLNIYFKPPIYAEKVVLKNGQEVDGKLLEKTNKEIKIDFQGVILTYSIDEIATIDNKPVQPSVVGAKDNVIMISGGEMAKVLDKEASDLLEKDPESAEANNKRGIALRMRRQGNDLQDSLTYFSKAIELNPGKSEYYQNRGISYDLTGNVDAAIADLNKAIELESKNPELYFNRALVYFKKKDYDKCWTDILKADSLGFREHFNSEEGMFLRLVTDLKELSGKNPYDSKEEVEAFDRASEYNKKGMFNESANELSKIIQINPTALYAYFYRAIVYQKIGNLQGAIADYSKYLSSYPDNAEVLAGRGACLTSIGQDDAALKDYNEAIKFDPNNLAAYFNRGFYYGKIHQDDKAIDDFTKSIEINPQDPLGYKYRAISYFSKGEYNKSWDDLHMAQKLGADIDPGFLGDLKKASGRNN
jgi:tetratricopeptide (TPR) repeat protein